MQYILSKMLIVYLTPRSFLFCDYDGTYETIAQYCEVKKLTGQQKSDTKTLADFRSRSEGILFLNSKHNAKGHNLEFVQQIILYHDVEPEIRKQIIGRAQRPGRDPTEQLQVYILIDNNESETRNLQR
jgi:hypothetical protein